MVAATPKDGIAAYAAASDSGTMTSATCSIRLITASCSGAVRWLKSAIGRSLSTTRSLAASFSFVTSGSPSRCRRPHPGGRRCQPLRRPQRQPARRRGHRPPCSRGPASLGGPPALPSFSHQLFAAHLHHPEHVVVHTSYYGRRPGVLGPSRGGCESNLSSRRPNPAAS